MAGPSASDKGFSMMQTFRQFVERNVLECRICLETMTGRVYSCRNGHACCEICKDKLPRCGYCRARIDIRCRPIEQLCQRAVQVPVTPARDQIPRPSFATPTATPTPTATAPPAPLKPPAGISNNMSFTCRCCRIRLTYLRLLKHVTSNYVYSSFRDVKLSSFTDQVYQVLPIIENNELFWLCVYQSDIYSFTALYMSAPKNVADKYTYHIQVKIGRLVVFSVRDKVYSEEEKLLNILPDMPDNTVLPFLNIVKPEPDVTEINFFVTKTQEYEAAEGY